VAAVEPDPPAAAKFYAQVFGWQTEDLMPNGSREHYIICKLRGRDVAGIVSAGPAPAPPRAIWATHVRVDSAEEIAEQAKAAGGAVVAAPWDSAAGGRMGVLADPAGAVFTVWEPGERCGARLVNEPSAYAISQLTTPDPNGAAAFYGQLFGWQADSSTFPGITLWRLPGYVGGEPKQPVPRDVIAVMARGEHTEPGRWSVDFWIADADAAAQAATALGGEVVVPPRDVPGFRNAVLADPQGAAFSVSKLVIAGA
jgi:predicted enzyme related to lactoylglutathione lyase